MPVSDSNSNELFLRYELNFTCFYSKLIVIKDYIEQNYAFWSNFENKLYKLKWLRAMLDFIEINL